MTTVRRRGRPRRSQNNNNSSNNQGRREARYRDKYVEAFHANTQVNPDHACYDRLELKLDAFKVYFDTKKEKERFRERLAQTGIIRPDRRSFNPHIRDEWLFAGRIFINNLDDEDSPHSKKIQYRLVLNPSRFVHHAFEKLNRDPEDFSLERLQLMGASELLTKEENIDPVHLSLDENDNYIPDAIFKQTRSVEDFLRLYIDRILELVREAVLESVEYALEREITDPDVIILEDNWVLNSTEIYWEYSVNDALSFVNGTWDGFQAVLYETERRDYYPTETVEAGRLAARTGRLQDMNGIALYANDFGVSGLRLVLYAKRHKRIRFELRYNRSIQSILSRRFTGTLTPQLESMYVALSEHKRVSQKRLKRMIRALPDLAYSERADYHVFADFIETLSEVSRLIPSFNLRATFSQLVNTGRMVVHLDTPDHEVMEELKRQYIVTDENSAYIRHDNDTRIYALTPRYLTIVQGFREVFREAEAE